MTPETETRLRMLRETFGAVDPLPEPIELDPEDVRDPVTVASKILVAEVEHSLND